MLRVDNAIFLSVACAALTAIGSACASAPPKATTPLPITKHDTVLKVDKEHDVGWRDAETGYVFVRGAELGVHLQLADQCRERKVTTIRRELRQGDQLLETKTLVQKSEWEEFLCNRRDLDAVEVELTFVRRGETFPLGTGLCDETGRFVIPEKRMRKPIVRAFSRDVRNSFLRISLNGKQLAEDRIPSRYVLHIDTTDFGEARERYRRKRAEKLLKWAKRNIKKKRHSKAFTQLNDAAHWADGAWPKDDLDRRVASLRDRLDSSLNRVWAARSERGFQSCRQHDPGHPARRRAREKLKQIPDEMLQFGASPELVSSWSRDFQEACN